MKHFVLLAILKTISLLHIFVEILYFLEFYAESNLFINNKKAFLSRLNILMHPC